jgi:hypothetical protein
MIFTAIGIAIFLLSVAGAVWEVRKTEPDQPRQIKVLRFMLYFWGYVFIQLIIAAIAYAVLIR